MRRRARLFALGFLLPTLLTAVPASSQVLYLDSNGDGVRDAQDRLNPDGPTTIDVWIVTDRNRDGTPVICDAETGTSLTVNSYAFVLHAVGGTMDWGIMTNRFPFVYPPVCVASDQDTTDAVYYHNGWAGRDILPPGRYRLATLTVRPASGRPSIFVEPVHPVLGTRITAFGTKCAAIDFDNTYKLGLDWFDARGLGTPQAAAGGPYLANPGEPVAFDGRASRDPAGTALSFAWDFGDGGTATGATPSHVYAAAGRYTARLTVTSESGEGVGIADVIVTDQHQPIARAGGPYEGRAGTPVRFDGRGSYDPDGDALRFLWSFGDGLDATGMTVDHTYAAPGGFVARLTVSDGTRSEFEDAAVTILAAATHAPVAAPGGPYAGFVGRNIPFDGRGSSDADGQAISYLWRFGDGATGYGSSTGHSYAAAGAYDVTLTVSDGELAGSATTMATVRAALAALAFTAEPGTPTIHVGAGEEPFSVNVQTADGSFGVEDVDFGSVVMRSAGTGSVSEIAAGDIVLADQDLNRDGVLELTARFSGDDLARLFDGVTQPTDVTVSFSGRLFGGGSFGADLGVNVRPGAGGLIKIAPNPFNPQALVTFRLTRPGPVRANLFDVRGRMVRTLLRGERMDPGSHDVILDATGDHGEALASGIYFLRLDGPDGVVTRRLAIAK